MLAALFDRFAGAWSGLFARSLRALKRIVLVYGFAPFTDGSFHYLTLTVTPLYPLTMSRIASLISRIVSSSWLLMVSE